MVLIIMELQNKQSRQGILSKKISAECIKKKISVVFLYAPWGN